MRHNRPKERLRPFLHAALKNSISLWLSVHSLTDIQGN